MSYRDPKIIDDKSGLIIPNAIANIGAQVSKAWGASLAATKKEKNLETQRLINGGNAIDAQYAKRTNEAYKLQVKGGEAFQQSVRDTQAHFNQEYADAAKALLKPQTPEEKARLLAVQANAAKQLNNINVAAPKIAEMGQDGQELMKDGNTLLGHTKSWSTLPSFTKDEKSPNTQKVMSSYNNAPDTSLLMSFDDNGNVNINSTWKNPETAETAGTSTSSRGSYSIGMDTFISDDVQVSDPITQVVTAATSDVGAQLMKNNKLNPKYTQNMQIITDRIKVMNEDGSWTGDYTVTKKQTLVPGATAMVEGVATKLISGIDAMIGDDDYYNIMKHQLNINEKTAKAYQLGEPEDSASDEEKKAYKDAVGTINLAANQAAAGSYGLTVQDTAEEGEQPAYRFTQDNASRVEYAPDKNVSVKKSEQLYAVYKKDFDEAVAAGGDLDSVAKSMFNIDKGLRIRFGKGYVEAYSASIENGVVSIVGTGNPKKEFSTSSDKDLRSYDLKNPEQRYNFIRLVNPMKDLQVREMSQQLGTLVN